MVIVLPMTWGCGTPLSHQLLPISDEIYPKNHGFLPAKEGFGCVYQGFGMSKPPGTCRSHDSSLKVLSHYQTKLQSGTNHGSQETRILLLYPFSHNHGSGKLSNERKERLKTLKHERNKDIKKEHIPKNMHYWRHPIFHFHDSLRGPR